MDILAPFFYDYRNHLSDLLDSFEAISFPKGYHFEKKDNGNYEISIPVESVDSSKIKVHVDDDKFVTVVYAKCTDTSTETFFFKETLPEDADANTLKADLVDGTLTVSVDRKCPIKATSKSIPITKKCSSGRPHCHRD